MPLHPHTQKILKKNKINTNIRIIDPVGYLGMIELLKKCKMVITDSGGLQKEAYFAKKKCLTVRDHTEWIELVEGGTNVLCKPKNILNKFNELYDKNCDFKKNYYGEGKASYSIVKSIINYLS